MTERKPPGMHFTSWIDQQIQEAQERGAFDDLPGTGKPLPRHPDDDGQRWIREKLRREGVTADELLPPPLKLRKERARLVESVPEMESEQEIRAAAADLNRRIAEWRRVPVGPPVFVRLVDADELVRHWTAGRPRLVGAVEGTPAPPAQGSPGQARAHGRPWWRRRRPRG